jgi:hypothetical protein
VVAEVVVAVDSLVLDNPTIIIPEPPEPLTVAMERVEAVVTEPVVEVVEVVKMVVLAVDCWAATTAAILEKMAIV